MQKTVSLLISAYKQSLRYPTIPKLHSRAEEHISICRVPKPVMDDFVDKAEELDMSREKGSRDRRGGKGNRGGKTGGGGGGKGEGREIMVSKALSKLLRHAAVEAGLKLDAEGYASVEQVVSSLLFFFLRLLLCGGGKGEGREIMVSKALSKLLRHAAVEAGLKLDAEGYASVEQVVSSLLFFFLRLLLCITGWTFDFRYQSPKSDIWYPKPDTQKDMSLLPRAKTQVENVTNTSL